MSQTMLALRCLMPFILAGVMAGLAMAEDPPSLNETPREKALRYLEQLDSPLFAQRNAASRELIELGRPIAPLLELEAKNRSPDVRRRVADILRHIHKHQPGDLRAKFTELARRSDDRIDLEQGMALIARILNPDVRREDLDRQLDEIANRVRDELGRQQDPRNVDPPVAVAAIRKVVFEEYGFKGNLMDYGNPDNSALDRVLATRRGLPILLSQVVLSVGRRLRVPLVGLPTPGRFIVKYDGAKAPAGFANEDILIDPFGGGRILGPMDLALLFPGVDPQEKILPAKNRETLRRILSNLERHLFDRNRPEQAYVALELAEILDDYAPSDE